MLNFNGEFVPKSELQISYKNRAFTYGDGVFDTLKYDGEIDFIEDHYFRLMSSMRMLRMKIPMHFTMQYYRDEILKTIAKNKLIGRVRIRVNIFRKEGGLYTPETNEINYIIVVENSSYQQKESYEIELYKDFPVLSGLLSTIKTTNRIVNILSAIFADENKYDNCILLNEKKNVVEATNANIFMIVGDTLITPPLTDGCINGIVRLQLIKYFKKSKDFKCIERSISPFELLKADEVFLTNSIFEFQSVTKYRKKQFGTTQTKKIKSIFKTEIKDKNKGDKI